MITEGGSHYNKEGSAFMKNRSTEIAFTRERRKNMYRVEWLDIDGEQKVVRGFETSEEAHEWIRTHHFDMDFEMPMVFYDGE